MVEWHVLQCVWSARAYALHAPPRCRPARKTFQTVPRAPLARSRQSALELSEMRSDGDPASCLAAVGIFGARGAVTQHLLTEGKSLREGGVKRRAAILCSYRAATGCPMDPRYRGSDGFRHRTGSDGFRHWEDYRFGAGFHHRNVAFSGIGFLFRGQCFCCFNAVSGLKSGNVIASRDRSSDLIARANFRKRGIADTAQPYIAYRCMPDQAVRAVHFFRKSGSCHDNFAWP
jgi:hypothetical protein